MSSTAEQRATHNAYMKAWREKNIERFRTPEARRRKADAANRQRRSNIRFIRAIKSMLCCVDCGATNDEARLDFDHDDPATKRFRVANPGSRSKAAILNEIAKCTVRCAACHSKRHIRLDPSKLVRAARAANDARRRRSAV